MVSEIHEYPSSNPNFPHNLDIHPSAIPISAQSRLQNDAPHLEAAFGSAAQEVAIQQYGIAGRVWEASYAMTSYIDPPPNLDFDPPLFNASESESSRSIAIVELGSGSGLVASTLSTLLNPSRDYLVATDLPEVCKLLEANLKAISPLSSSNASVRGPGVTIFPVSWGNHDDALALASAFRDEATNRLTFGSLTHIICSDLVYFPELLAPLLRSLLHLSSPPFVDPSSDTTPDKRLSVFISYKIRSLAKETPFWSAFGLWFDFSPVLSRTSSGGPDPPVWKRFGADFDDTTFLFVAHRRAESYGWELPHSDRDLLAGVGAYGTSTTKGDDTFENLLLMSLNQD
ncbi:hypothetical protein BDN70DRAFT_905714 [Pholiota conissans]|uniref:Methyltransferase n=1 Tax=Pholiota conissans TaxID=109636 RepID=A0A9P5Z6V2_9AGAR|nr:hypothetical protein BDN70DRAFT_905714 [Pholiota conissans]